MNKVEVLENGNVSRIISLTLLSPEIIYGDRYKTIVF